jgi:uncharacterized protein (DUF697 family)
MSLALSQTQPPKVIGVVRERSMDRDVLADRIIHDHTTYALVAGAIPVPLLDIAAVAAVQLDAIRALAKVYQAEFDPALGKGLIGSIVGASAAKLGTSVAKAIPGVAWIPSTLAASALAGASTYAVGHLFRQHFARQGTLRDLDPASSRALYDELLQRGRTFIRTLRSPTKPGVEDATALLERLGRLRDQGVLDEAEFDRLKREILAAAI